MTAMRSFLPFLLAAIPLLPLVAGLFARGSLPTVAGQLTATAARLSALLAVIAAAFLVLGGPFTARWLPFGADTGLTVFLRLDAISAVMVVLVSFLGAIVLKFS